MAFQDDCVLCTENGYEVFPPEGDSEQKCTRCGYYVIENRVIREFLLAFNKTLKLHLLSGYTRERHERREVAKLTTENVNEIIAQSPQTIPAMAHKLLEALHHKTQHFGHWIGFPPPSSYPLAYAKNSEECVALIRYLEELGFLEKEEHSGYGQECSLRLKAEGFEAIESRRLLPPVTAFISSTCLDLADLRAELAAFLDGQGCTVRVSEDPDRFNVDPTGDAMKTCLRNVETSDVVVCILDRRYGTATKAEPYPELSATHAEFRHAKGHDPEIPTYVFIRERAMADYNLLAGGSATSTSWVERDNEEDRRRWLDFARELTESKWVDQFKTSVDLKKLVLKRLADYQQTSIPRY